MSVIDTSLCAQLWLNDFEMPALTDTAAATRGIGLAPTPTIAPPPLVVPVLREPPMADNPSVMPMRSMALPSNASSLPMSHVFASPNSPSFTSS